VDRPPERLEDYVAYAVAFARRYGAGGDFWVEHPELPQLPVTHYEIWNEPNLERFWPGQETAPERYADMYVAAQAAIKAVDPNAVVVVGGLIFHGVEEWVTRMVAARPELVGGVDAVGFHPYGGDYPVTYERIRGLRRALDASGNPQAAIEITETGLAVPPATEERRAAVLARLAQELPRSDCGVTRIIPYTFVTPELDPENREHFFGIADHDGSLKPSGRAYADAVAQSILAGDVLSPVDRLPICYPVEPL
jgi:hypothetical protein